MLRDYYSLTKSGLVYGNLIPAIGGFMMVARVIGSNFITLLAAIVGIALVMASGCVFNNVIDRDIDNDMTRTKDRALVAGRIKPRQAIVFGMVLGILGFATLAAWTNLLTTGVAAVGWVAYVVLYSLWAKRRTVHGATVGSISGAVPPVVGYVAASGRLDLGAALLFIILALWQMPHFFAIGIYRAEDYAAAHIPILPVRRSLRTTKILMAIYIALFTAATIALAVFGYVDTWFLIIALTLSIVWFGYGLSGFMIKNEAIGANNRWARKMFFISLIVLTAIFVAMIFL